MLFITMLLTLVVGVSILCIAPFLQDMRMMYKWFAVGVIMFFIGFAILCTWN